MIGLIIAAIIVAFILLLIYLPVVAYSILALLALLVLVLLLVPIGVELSYIDGIFSLAAKLSFYTHKLLPKKEAETTENKKEKAEGKKDKVSPAAEKRKKKLNLNFDEIIEIIKKALKGLSKFGKLTVHKFMFHYIAGGNDPYSTAMTYNYVNAGLSSLAPCCAKAFRVRGAVDVWTDVDFTREKMLIDTEVSISLRLIQLLHVAAVAGFGVLCILIKNRLRISRERKADKKLNKNSANMDVTENNKEINIQTEERKESNG